MKLDKRILTMDLLSEFGKKITLLSVQPLPMCIQVERVISLRVLGVILNEKLTATDHVSYLLESCSRLLFVYRTLHSHGLNTVSLQDVFRSTALAKIAFCSPA